MLFPACLQKRRPFSWGRSPPRSLPGKGLFGEKSETLGEPFRGEIDSPEEPAVVAGLVPLLGLSCSCAAAPGKAGPSPGRGEPAREWEPERFEREVLMSHQHRLFVSDLSPLRPTPTTGQTHVLVRVWLFYT